MKEQLSFDDQINYALVLNELKKLDSDKLDKVMDTLMDDLESFKVYLKMNKISDLIYNFLNNANAIMEIKPEDIEEQIKNLPDYHIMHIDDKRLTRIYKNYCSRLYEFMLYENINNRYELFNKYEVKSIVVNEAIKKLKSMELQEDMPHEIYSIIYNLRHNKNYTPNISNYVLSYLYATENNIELTNYSKELDAEKNKQLELKAKLESDLESYKEKTKKSRLKLYNAIGIKFGIPIALFAGTMFGGYKIGVDAYKKQSVTFENSDSEALESDLSDSYLEQDILNKLINTDRKLVTVFGETKGETVEVKVYDYSYTGFSNEELQTMELDDSKIIYSESLDVNKIASAKTGASHVYGKYTGAAHRDIANVSFIDDYENKKGEVVGISVAIGIMLAMLAVIIITVATLESPSEVIEDIIDSITDFGYYRDKKKESIEEYEKVVNKIKEIKKRLDLEKKKKEVLGQTIVEKELEDNRPVGFRI